MAKNIDSNEKNKSNEGKLTFLQKVVFTLFPDLKKMSQQPAKQNPEKGVQELTPPPTDVKEIEKQKSKGEGSPFVPKFSKERKFSKDILKLAIGAEFKDANELPPLEKPVEPKPTATKTKPTAMTTPTSKSPKSTKKT